MNGSKGWDWDGAGWDWMGCMGEMGSSACAVGWGMLGWDAIDGMSWVRVDCAVKDRVDRMASIGWHQ